MSGRAWSDDPITPELIADLQAGLLDDQTAARVRERVRTDPEAARTLAALDRVRRELADLGSDGGSAPPVPDDVIARVTTALTGEPAPHRVTGGDGHGPATHTQRPVRPPLGRARLLAAAAGAVATVVAVAVGAAVLVRTPAPTRSAGMTAEHITVARPARDIPLSDTQIAGLMTRPADYGPLSDPARLASCLTGLGYPAGTPVLGAQRLDLRGHLGVLLLLPADTPDSMVALVVSPQCGPADTGLLATTVLPRP